MADSIFVRKRTPTVMDGLVIRWQLRGDVYDGEISASRNGVLITGRWPVFSGPAAIAAIHETLDLALRTHEHLRSASYTSPFAGSHVDDADLPGGDRG